MGKYNERTYLFYGSMIFLKYRVLSHQLFTFNSSISTLDGNFDNIILSGPNFDAVYLQPGRTQGFYITLPTKSLLYRTTALAVGSTYIRNDDIIISVGIGVGEYPLGTTFYNSRGLYGKVLYGFKSACNSDTAVTYNFVVYYPKE